MQDKDLIRRAKDGDPQALDQLIARFDRYVFGVALLTLNDRAEAQDAAQEALVKAVRGLQSFNGKASLRTWIYRITVNACRDALRRRARRREVSLENAPLPARDSALQAALDRERRQTIWQAVQALDPPLREVVVLRYYLELPCAEISKVTGAPTNTIYWRLHQARRELELSLADDLLAEEGPGRAEKECVRWTVRPSRSDSTPTWPAISPPTSKTSWSSIGPPARSAEHRWNERYRLKSCCAKGYRPLRS